MLLLFLLSLQDSLPFAVIGSNAIVELKGRKVRVRQYPWGVAEGNTACRGAQHFLLFFLTPVHARF